MRITRSPNVECISSPGPKLGQGDKNKINRYLLIEFKYQKLYPAKLSSSAKYIVGMKKSWDIWFPISHYTRIPCHLTRPKCSLYRFQSKPPSVAAHNTHCPSFFLPQISSSYPLLLLPTMHETATFQIPVRTNCNLNSAWTANTSKKITLFSLAQSQFNKIARPKSHNDS